MNHTDDTGARAQREESWLVSDGVPPLVAHLAYIFVVTSAVVVVAMVSWHMLEQTIPPSSVQPGQGTHGRSTARRSGAGRLSRALLLVLAIASGLLLLLAIASRPAHVSLYHSAVAFGLPIVVCIGALAAMRLRQPIRTVLVVNLAAVAVACYGFELASAVLHPRWYSNMVLHTIPPGVDGSTLDRRTPLAVAQRIRDSTGIRAYPLPSRPTIAEIFQANPRPPRAVRPIAGVAGVTTVLCSERGPYQRYESDRFGFNNPDSVWDRPTTLALLGDSFVQGNCVPADSTIGAVLRADGVRAVSLGVSGNGPLSILGELREYVPRLAPKIIGWTYYEGNDLCDLDEELRDPVLPSYLKPEFRQSLVTRQTEVDQLLRPAYDADLSLIQRRFGHRTWSWRNFLTLGQVRQLLGVGGLTEQQRGRGACADVATFERILGLAKREATSIGAQLVLIYLPSKRPSSAIPHTPETKHDTVLAISRSLGVPFVDLRTELHAAEIEQRVWVYPMSHYTPEGYRRVARAIERAFFGKPSVRP